MRGDEQPLFCGIAIMAKASRAGLTKTRLSPPLSPDDAARCNTAFLRDVADNLLRASTEASISGYAAFGPAGSEEFFRGHLPPAIGLLEIWYPDFGLCLMRALEAQFALGHRAACVLNSDSPTLPSAFLAEAASVLAAPGDRIVLGPSIDGGYYILGCKRIHARLFEDIAWSTETVAPQTLERAAELGLAVHMLPVWYDVDDAISLRIARREVLEGVRYHPRIAPSPAGNTAALFSRLLIDDSGPAHPVPAPPRNAHLSALTSR